MRKQTLVSLLLIIQLTILSHATSQEQLPVLEFPVQGLDDMAAYRDYQTRFFRDAKGNTIQIVLNQANARVVNLWADAANESISFSLRDSGRVLPRTSWNSTGAIASTDGALRVLEYTLTVHTPVVRIGHVLLGSMRKERDFQYAKREMLPLDSLPPVEPELLRLVASLNALPEDEKREQLSRLSATHPDEIAGRLRPHVAMLNQDGRWLLDVRQRTFDGLNHLLLQVLGDTTQSHATMSNGILTVTSKPQSPTINIIVRIGTDSEALTPLATNQIFTPAFEQFYARQKAKGAEGGGQVQGRFALLERQVKSVELLSSKEKLMAGLPNYATYFGRDMMMSAMMMESILRPSMQEYVISAVLRKLSSEGKVSHEEALGGQAIRENADVYDKLIEASHSASAGTSHGPVDPSLKEARSILSKLQSTRENYLMVDETFQLPVIAAKYLIRSDVTAKEKKKFLLDTLDGTTRLARLMRNLEYIERVTAPFSAKQDVLNLISFQKREDGTWASGSWRDSGAGYAGGRFAMDVNAIWVPLALQGMQTIFKQLRAINVSRSDIEHNSPKDPDERSQLKKFSSDASDLDEPISHWMDAGKFFVVKFRIEEVRNRVTARLAALPESERAFWSQILPSALSGDSIAFLALSLDSLGRPIPVMNTDPATWLFINDLATDLALGKADTTRLKNALHTFLLPYPVGLFDAGLGDIVANDAYAAPAVWDRFEKDLYHSPRVVWGREVNLVLLGAMKIIQGLRAAATPKLVGATAPLVQHLSEVLNRVRQAVDTSGMKQNELWTYKIAGGSLRPERYEFSCDIQLWNLTDLAVQFEYDRLKNRPKGQ